MSFPWRRILLLSNRVDLDLSESVDSLVARLQHIVQKKKWFRWWPVDGFEGDVSASEFHMQLIDAYTAPGQFSKSLQAVRVKGRLETLKEGCRVHLLIRHGWHFRLFVWLLLPIIAVTLVMWPLMLIRPSLFEPRDVEVMKFGGPASLLMLGLFWCGMVRDVRKTEEDVVALLSGHSAIGRKGTTG